MKQIFINRGLVHIDNVPAPIIESGHVLVEVVYSLISTGTELGTVKVSDQSLIKKALAQPEKISKLLEFFKTQGIQKTIAKVTSIRDQAIPIGYSCSGIVIQVGEGIVDIKQGDRVACAGAGIANHAEVVLVPRNLLVKIPDQCSLKDAASMTLGAIALQGVRRSDPRLGEIIAVIGLGLLGQLTVQLLKASGCKVIGFDLDERRNQTAIELGADYAFQPSESDPVSVLRDLTNGFGVDATIITAAADTDQIVNQAMEMTRKKGRVVIVGAVGLGLKRSPFYEKEIDLLISCSYGPGRYDYSYEEKGIDYPYNYVRWTENRNMQDYLRLVAEKKVVLDSILEKEYELDEAPKAYEELQTAQVKPLGVILHFPAETQNHLQVKTSTKVNLLVQPVSKKINIAIIGAGSFAKTVHLPNLLSMSDRYCVRAIVSSTGGNAKNTATTFGAAYASTDYKDVLEDPEVDAVFICTRHNLHAQQAIQAAHAGKAIFLEKPMATSKKDLDQLVAVLTETEVPFMVGYNRRYSPFAQTTKKIISNRTNPLMITYRMNAGYLPPEHWTQTDEGGGRIVGEACHIFDLFQYLIDSPVAEFSTTSINSKTRHILNSDNVVKIIKYTDGSVANLIYTSLGTPELGKEYMEIYCDGKIIVLDDYRSLKAFGLKHKSINVVQPDKGHLEELRVFAKAILTDNRYPTSLQDLYNTSIISLEKDSEEIK
ncbi:MAG: oxidoreductase [Chloroflexi bacterium HGW-Chloroflexi-4]|jgi:predicted dehydrogenase/NADPH:quinone reductase-like Zn-dependent oxidoreductase|nr:MAG: oxidoreductase [Chloroflexi bacterium HGW-Chloroflexi-4]